MKALICSVPVELPSLNLSFRPVGEIPILPKMAIISLIQWMRNQGVDEDSWDFLDIDMLLPNDIELAAYFREICPDIFGLSAVTSGSFAQVKRIAAIARKECPNSTIVLGGNLSASAEVVLKRTSVDICVVGAGEIAWCELLKMASSNNHSVNKRELVTINGLAYLDDTGGLIFTGYGKSLAQADMAYIPDYAIMEKGLRGKAELLSNYFRPGKHCSWFSHDPRASASERQPNIANIVTNKGCVARCTFCQRSAKGYSPIKLDALEAHIQELVSKYSVGFINVCDENFGSDQEHAFEFSKLMKRFDLLWIATGVRCDSVTEASINSFASHNCVALKFGVESGSQKILDLMEKKFKVEQVKKALMWSNNAGLYSPLAIMFGMPGETYSTAKETGQFLGEMALARGGEWKKTPPDIFYAIPFPGTPLYEYGQQVGVIESTLDGEADFLTNVNTAATHKLGYVNLNGAPLIEALTWDLFAQIEASRVYYSGNEGKQASAIKKHLPSYASISQSDDNDLTVINNGFGDVVRRARLLARKMWSAFNMLRLLASGYPSISILLDLKFVRSRFSTKIPTWILEPLLKSIILFEYGIVIAFAKIRGNRNYRYIRTAGKVRRVSDDYAIEFPNKRTPSVRTIAMTRRSNPKSSEAESRIKLIGGY